MTAALPLTSRAWRLNNLYTIRDADGRLVPFRPNLAQRHFYNRMWTCNHVLKARKLGFSTFIEILFADDLIFTPGGLTAGIIDYTIEDAESKLAMLHTAWEHLDNGDLHPETWKLGRLIKQAVPLRSHAARKLVFGNGSVAKCATSLRGTTPQRVHISELGKTAVWAPKKAREIVNGAFNAMTPGNVRNIESTHEGGRTGEHYRLLNLAMRHDDTTLSTIQSRFHFFPWHLDPRYVLPVAASKLRPEIERYFQRLHHSQGITCSPGQMRWYDEKQNEQGHGMKKEFPSTPGEAFEAISDHAIYGTQMADLRAKGRIADFEPERHLPLFTFWDIGLSDYTAVWLIQPAGRAFLCLDWHETDGETAAGHADHMRRWETKWGRPIASHFLPHDANIRDRGTGLTYRQCLHDAGIPNTRVVPRTPDIWTSIGHVRDLLPHLWFHKTHCDTPRTANGEEHPSGVACLEGYQKHIAATGRTLRELPQARSFLPQCGRIPDIRRSLAPRPRRSHPGGGPASEGDPRMSPYLTAHHAYQAQQPAIPWTTALDFHLQHGVVLSTADLFLMARPVRLAGSDHDHLTLSLPPAGADALHIWMAAGTLQAITRELRRLPWLKAITFLRPNGRLRRWTAGIRRFPHRHPTGRPRPVREIRLPG